MTNVTAILSLLHEPATRNSATRAFRGRPVLAWTLERLARSRRLTGAAILCWDDQLGAVGVVTEGEIRIFSRGPRVRVPEIESVAAARRWADGWRGGLLSTCDFDLGFYGPWACETADAMASDAVVLIDPAAGLVDPTLVDSIVDHATARGETEFFFAQAAPGLCGPLLRRPMLQRLAAAKAHPGRVLHYLPDQISREMLGGDSSASVPTTVARSLHRLTLDSARQVARVGAATMSLNGQLGSTGAEDLVRRMDALPPADPLPREVMLELNTQRLSRPIFLPASTDVPARGPLPREAAFALVDELAAYDDVRLTIAGVGDPLLYEGLFALLESPAVREGRVAVHVETDLLGPSPEAITRLASSAVDVVSVHIPALSAANYEGVMGVAGYGRVLENVRIFAAGKQSGGSRLPILVPTFTKCRHNQAEMEEWYDRWLRAAGAAVIRGPSDFGGELPDVAVADMAPPRRRPCARLTSRLTVLSDGRYVSCEEDLWGRQPLGEIGKHTLRDVWQVRAKALREDHAGTRWQRHPVCARCREWHRR